MWQLVRLGLAGPHGVGRQAVRPTWQRPSFYAAQAGEVEGMRYRRMSYHYTVVWTGDPMRPLGYVEYSERAGVRFAQTRWRPAADVFETADGLFVVVELAGVDYDQLDVTVYEDALVVEGERRLRPALGEGVYHAAEIRQGPFRLELPLPAGLDVDRVDARYEQGLLWIAFAKAEGR